MAFPTIPTGQRLAVNTQADTTTTRTFPTLTNLTKNSGDLLIAICVCYSASSAPQFSSWGAGFTEFVDTTTAGAISIGMAWKVSDGTETGTFTVTASNSGAGHSQQILLSIPGADTSAAPEVGSSFTTANNAAADPASLSPSWGADDTLWINLGAAGETSITGSWTSITGSPANYSDFIDAGQSADVVGAVHTRLGFRQLNAASEDAPAYTFDTSNSRSGAIVIAVRPVGSTPKSGSESNSLTISDSSSLTVVTAVSASESNSLTATDASGTMVKSTTSTESNSLAVSETVEITKQTAESNSLAAADASNVTVLVGGTLTPAHVNSTQTINSSSSSNVVNVPSGTQDGHFMVMYAVINGSNTITDPAGWNLIQTQDPTGSFTARAKLYWRIASSEPSNYTINFGATDRNGATITTFSNVAGLDDAAYSTITASSTSIAATAVTTAANNDMLYFVVANDGATAQTLSTPGTMTVASQSTAVAGSVHSAYEVIASPGSTGTRTSTVTTTANMNAMMVALKAASAGSESNSLAVADSSSLLISEAKSGSESNSLAVSETTSSLRTIVASDSGSVAVTDAATTTLVAFSASESNSLTITESSDVQGSLTTVSGSESNSLTITESRSIAVTLAGTEDPSVGLAVESAETFVTISRTDSAAITVTEETSFANDIVATDEAAITVTEDGYFGVSTIDTEDASALTINEEYELLVPRTGSDSAAVTITETSDRIVTTTVDSGSIAVTEASAITNIKAGEETIPVAVDETQESTSTLTDADSSAVSVEDIADTLVTPPTVTDSAAVAVSESYLLVVQFSSDGDSASLAVDDISTAPLVQFSATDTASISVAENNTGSFSKSDGDSASLSVSDVSVISEVFFKVASDSAAISVSETAGYVIPANRPVDPDAYFEVTHFAVPTLIAVHMVDDVVATHVNAATKNVTDIDAPSIEVEDIYE